MSNASLPVDSADSVYGDEYYHSHCGDVPYTADSAYWKDFYSRIADEIVRSLGPARVFDAGCAIGFLVAALWDRGVEARGRDISSFAISQVRPDVRQYCSVGSISDAIDGDVDLVTCIEVLEHMPEDEAVEAIASMTRAAPRILFSSTPSDFEEPTHVNVRPTLYWLQAFARHGFAPVAAYDASFVASHAMLLERGAEPPDQRELVGFAEIIRQRLLRLDDGRKTAELARLLNEVHGALAQVREEFATTEAELRVKLDDAERRAAALTIGAQARRLVRRSLTVVRLTVTLQLFQRLRARREWRALQAAPAIADATEVAPTVPEASRLVAARFESCAPLLARPSPESSLRLTIVTDSIAEGSLYGGVGTALILATLLAEHTHARLRLITRTEPAHAERIKTVLDAQGVSWLDEIENVHAPPQGGESIPVGDRDIFLTTSWWTTKATLASVPLKQVIYLLQEDERMFYPRGDDQLRCEETLATPGLRCVVNSELLHRHLCTGPDALAGLAQRSTWFEPAFPEGLFYDDLGRERHGESRRFLFYARPNNVRNLYWRGLEAVITAMEDGILDPQLWSFTFVGRDLGTLLLPGGIQPELLENLPWDRYAELIRSVDLGLSLMDTPHASYPPLDLAASGAVVVTNSCGVKRSLAVYSDNIITVPATVGALRDAIRDGAALVADERRRRTNYLAARIPRDWRQTLAGTIRACAAWMDS